MEEIEYLEEYEDLILPTINSNSTVAQSTPSVPNMATTQDDEDSSSIDQDIFESLFDGQSDDDNILQKDPKLSSQRDDRVSLDSLDMLVKDLVGERLSPLAKTGQKAANTKKVPSTLPPARTLTKGHNTPNAMRPATSSAAAAAVAAKQKFSTNKPKSIATVRPTIQQKYSSTNIGISRSSVNTTPMTTASTSTSSSLSRAANSSAPKAATSSQAKTSSSFAPKASSSFAPKASSSFAAKASSSFAVKASSSFAVKASSSFAPKSSSSFALKAASSSLAKASSSFAGKSVSPSLAKASGSFASKTTSSSSVSKAASSSSVAKHTSSSSPKTIAFSSRKQISAATSTTNETDTLNVQRKNNRPQPTIIKPEKPQARDPAEDPLSLEGICDDIDSDSDSLTLSDISGDSFASLSDLDDDVPKNIIDISNDSSSEKINLEKMRGETPSPTVSDIEKNDKNAMSSPTLSTSSSGSSKFVDSLSKLEVNAKSKLSKSAKEKIAKQRVADFLAGDGTGNVKFCDLSRKEVVADKVTIISDTLLTRIDEAIKDTTELERRKESKEELHEEDVNMQKEKNHDVGDVQYKKTSSSTSQQTKEKTKTIDITISASTPSENPTKSDENLENDRDGVKITFIETNEKGNVDGNPKKPESITENTAEVEERTCAKYEEKNEEAKVYTEDETTVDQGKLDEKSNNIEKSKDTEKSKETCKIDERTEDHDLGRSKNTEKCNEESTDNGKSESIGTSEDHGNPKEKSKNIEETKQQEKINDNFKDNDKIKENPKNIETSKVKLKNLQTSKHEEKSNPKSEDKDQSNEKSNESTEKSKSVEETKMQGTSKNIEISKEKSKDIEKTSVKTKSATPKLENSNDTEKSSKEKSKYVVKTPKRSKNTAGRKEREKPKEKSKDIDSRREISKTALKSNSTEAIKSKDTENSKEKPKAVEKTIEKSKSAEKIIEKSKSVEELKVHEKSKEKSRTIENSFEKSKSATETEKQDFSKTNSEDVEKSELESENIEKTRSMFHDIENSTEEFMGFNETKEEGIFATSSKDIKMSKDNEKSKEKSIHIKNIERRKIQEKLKEASKGHKVNTKPQQNEDKDNSGNKKTNAKIKSKTDEKELEESQNKILLLTNKIYKEAANKIAKDIQVMERHPTKKIKVLNDNKTSATPKSKETNKETVEKESKQESMNTLNETKPKSNDNATITKDKQLKTTPSKSSKEKECANTEQSTEEKVQTTKAAEEIKLAEKSTDAAVVSGKEKKESADADTKVIVRNLRTRKEPEEKNISTEKQETKTVANIAKLQQHEKSKTPQRTNADSFLIMDSESSDHEKTTEEKDGITRRSLRKRAADTPTPPTTSTTPSTTTTTTTTNDTIPSKKIFKEPSTNYETPKTEGGDHASSEENKIMSLRLNLRSPARQNKDSSPLPKRARFELSRKLLRSRHNDSSSERENSESDTSTASKRSKSEIIDQNVKELKLTEKKLTEEKTEYTRDSARKALSKIETKEPQAANKSEPEIKEPTQSDATTDPKLKKLQTGKKSKELPQSEKNLESKNKEPPQSENNLESKNKEPPQSEKNLESKIKEASQSEKNLKSKIKKASQSEKKSEFKSKEPPKSEKKSELKPKEPFYIEKKSELKTNEPPKSEKKSEIKSKEPPQTCEKKSNEEQTIESPLKQTKIDNVTDKSKDTSLPPKPTTVENAEHATKIEEKVTKEQQQDSKLRNSSKTKTNDVKVTTTASHETDDKKPNEKAITVATTSEAADEKQQTEKAKAETDEPPRKLPRLEVVQQKEDVTRKAVAAKSNILSSELPSKPAVISEKKKEDDIKPQQQTNQRRSLRARETDVSPSVRKSLRTRVHAEEKEKTNSPSLKAAEEKKLHEKTTRVAVEKKETVNVLNATAKSATISPTTKATAVETSPTRTRPTKSSPTKSPGSQVMTFNEWLNRQQLAAEEKKRLRESPAAVEHDNDAIMIPVTPTTSVKKAMENETDKKLQNQEKTTSMETTSPRSEDNAATKNVVIKTPEIKKKKPKDEIEILRQSMPKEMRDSGFEFAIKNCRLRTAPKSLNIATAAAITTTKGAAAAVVATTTKGSAAAVAAAITPIKLPVATVDSRRTAAKPNVASGKTETPERFKIPPIPEKPIAIDLIVDGNLILKDDQQQQQQVADNKKLQQKSQIKTTSVQSVGKTLKTNKAKLRKLLVRINRHDVTSYFNRLNLKQKLTRHSANKQQNAFNLSKNSYLKVTKNKVPYTYAPGKILSKTLTASPKNQALQASGLNKSMPSSLVFSAPGPSTGIRSATAKAGPANVLTIPPQNRRPPQTLTHLAQLLSNDTTSETEDEYETQDSILDEDMESYLLTPMRSSIVNPESGVRKQQQFEKSKQPKVKVGGSGVGTQKYPVRYGASTATAPGTYVQPTPTATASSTSATFNIQQSSSISSNVTSELESLMSSALEPKIEIQEDLESFLTSSCVSTTNTLSAAGTGITTTAAAAESTANSSQQLAASMFGLTPPTVDLNGTRLYSFLHPAKYNRSHSHVLLDYCCPNLDGPMPAIDPTRIHAQVQTPVRELPAYIVMTTKLITRADLEGNNNTIPASIRQKVERITSNSSTVAAGAIGATTSAVSIALAAAANKSSGTLQMQGSSSLSTAPYLSALQKQLPASTIITPKPHPAVASITITKPGGGEVTQPVQPVTHNQLNENQRLAMRTYLRRIDASLKKLAPRFNTLSFGERQNILEHIFNTAVHSLKDYSSAARVLDEYLIKTNTTLLASSLSQPSGLSGVVSFDKVHGKAVKRFQSSPTHGGPAAQQKSSQYVPIFDTDKNIIGYQIATSLAATQSAFPSASASSSLNSNTKSIMSTHANIMSTSSQAKRPTTSAANVSTTSGTPIAAKICTRKQPIQDSPRIFYTNPAAMQTSTPIASASNTSATGVGVSPSSVSSSSNASTSLRSTSRLGRDITIRQLNTPSLTTTTTVTASAAAAVASTADSVPVRLPTLIRNPNLTSATSTATSTANTTSTTKSAITMTTPPTLKRMTRKTAAAAAAQVIVITQDGNTTSDECILPDGDSIPQIKSEKDDEDFIGGS